MHFYNNTPDPSFSLSCLDINQMLKIRETNISKCPHCSQKNYIKHGYYNNLQRYKCKNLNCNKTFSATTNSPCSYTKKSFNLWKDFIKLMFENNTLSQCATILQIHISTAFFWRHKILVSMDSFFKPGELKDFIEMSKFKFIENFKGSREITSSIRKPIWLISAVDINNTIISDIVSIGPINIQIIKESIYQKVPKDAYLHCYPDMHLINLGRLHNKFLVPTHPLDQRLALSFSTKISKWFYRFKGIATKYLKSYLIWYFFNFVNYNNNFSQLITNILLENSFTRLNEFKNFKLC